LAHVAFWVRIELTALNTDVLLSDGTVAHGGQPYPGSVG
jgi:hypothetical protein